jgi:hypothetical protein
LQILESKQHAMHKGNPIRQCGMPLAIEAIRSSNRRAFHRGPLEFPMHSREYMGKYVDALSNSGAAGPFR